MFHCFACGTNLYEDCDFQNKALFAWSLIRNLKVNEITHTRGMWTWHHKLHEIFSQWILLFISCVSVKTILHFHDKSHHICISNPRFLVLGDFMPGESLFWRTSPVNLHTHLQEYNLPVLCFWFSPFRSHPLSLQRFSDFNETIPFHSVLIICHGDVERWLN